MNLFPRIAEDAGFLAESRVTELNIAYSVPIPLEIFTTGFRLWVRWRAPAKGGFTFDDYLMVWATICGVAVCVSGLVYGPPFGFGRHKAALSNQQIQTFMLGNYVFSHFYNAAIASTKLSVLALYHRIFATFRFRIVVLVTAIFVILWLIAMEVVLGLQCRPIAAFWDSDIPGTCFDLVAFSYFTNITNLVADIWIFALPLPVIFQLKMSRNRKIALSFLFSIGLATCAISAARLSVVVSQGSPDFTWAGVPLGILSAWEPLGGIFCANLPVIYRALATMVRSLKSSVHGNFSRSGTPGSQPHPDTHGSHSQRPWAPLDNGRSAQMVCHSQASGNKSAGAGTELESIGRNAIKVEQYFEQQIYHEGDEMPLHPAQPARR